MVLATACCCRRCCQRTIGSARVEYNGNATGLAALFSGTGGIGDRLWLFPACTTPLLVPDEDCFL